MNQWLAERVYYLLSDPSKKVILNIGFPSATPPNGDFRCEVKVSGNTGVQESILSIGVDPMSAIYSAIFMAQSLMTTINQNDFSGELRWLEDSSNSLGFDLKF